jgi:hypothetical protein
MTQREIIAYVRPVDERPLFERAPKRKGGKPVFFLRHSAKGKVGGMESATGSSIIWWGMHEAIHAAYSSSP